MPAEDATFIGPRAAPEITITLLHGTFARGAKWTCPDSLLCKALAYHFGQRLLIDVPTWSSGNTVRARANASAKVQESVMKLIESYPHARHFIIGHSHGGSVAWQAMSDDVLQRHVAGVVSLSTPFLHAQPRAHRPNRGDEPLTGMAKLLPWLVSLNALALGCSIGQISPTRAGRLAGVIGLVIATGTFFRYIVLTSLRRTQSHAMDRFRLPCLPPESVLIVRVAGDEASALLSTVAFASWVLTRLNRMAASVFGVTASAGKWIMDHAIHAMVVYIVMMILNFGVLPVVISRFGDLPEAVLAVLIILMLLPFFLAASAPFLIAALYVAEGVISLILTPLLVLALPTSFDLWLLPFMISITPEACPPGAYTLHQFAAQKEGSADAIPGGLLHSLAYDDPRVIELLINWMEGRLQLAA
jgi:hypothetical protein